MIPGRRQKCVTRGCRHTQPEGLAPWTCPDCRREKAIQAAERRPSVVYLAQCEGISVGEWCRLWGKGHRKAATWPSARAATGNASPVRTSVK